jgi:hypothetical protein
MEMFAPGVRTLPGEFPDLLRHKLRAAQIGISEREDEELVGVRNRVSAGVSSGLEEVVVVGDPEGVNGCASIVDIGSEGNTLDLGRDVACRDACCGKRLDDVEEGCFGDGVRGRSGAVHGADVDGSIEVDLKSSLTLALFWSARPLPSRSSTRNS